MLAHHRSNLLGLLLWLVHATINTIIRIRKQSLRPTHSEDQSIHSRLVAHCTAMRSNGSGAVAPSILASFDIAARLG